MIISFKNKKILSYTMDIQKFQAVTPPIPKKIQEDGDEKWEEAEIIQRKMRKRITGLRTTTANEVVLGELGWLPMKTRRDILRLRYWYKILKMKSDRIPRCIYEADR